MPFVCRLLSAFVTVLLVTSFGTASARAQEAPSVTASASTVKQGHKAARRAPAEVWLSVGRNGVVHYERSPEARGPAAVEAADDGTFWIVDGVARRLVHVDERGALLGTLPLPSSGVSSLVVTADGVHILGLTAGVTTFYHLTFEGRTRASLPVESATALLRGGNAVWVQASELLRYDPVQRSLQPDAASASTAAVELCEPTANAGFVHHCIQVRVGARQVRFQVPAHVQGARVVRLLADGSLMLELALVTAQGAPDAQVWHIDARSTLLGKARFRREGATFVEQPLAIQPDGTPYALSTRDHSSSLLKLELVRELSVEPY